jgi:pSer/pThr/pTyr-binding forkhead associated (FHA) protein
VNHEPLGPFLEACGVPGGLRLAVQGPGGPQVTRPPLLQPFAVIGRDPGADLPLDDPAVNWARHAYLQALGGRVFCVDLGSRTGVHWDTGPRVNGWLRPGEAVRVGSSRVRLLPGADAPANAGDEKSPLAAGSLALGVASPVVLEFPAGATRDPLWRPDRQLTLVGNGRGCKLWLRSKRVSRYHCSLVATPAGLWVVDLLSREGVLLNGAPVRCATLRDGDELQVGSFLLRVRQDGSAGRLRPAAARPGSALALPRPQALVPGGPVPADGGAAEAYLSPLVSQFALMQQQMFDQFQQAMAMMVQMFRGLHQDQTALIRDELDRVQELTRELQTLQAQLNRPAPAAATTREAAAPGPAPAPAAVPSPATSTGPAAPQAPAAPQRTVGAVPTAGPRPQPAPADGVEGQEFQVWLLDRMAALQEERQSRWQKILGFLGGNRS